MPTSEQYRAFLWWFYPNFLGLSLMSQTFVIYVIVYHTPKNLQRLKAILINTCFFQVIHVTVCFVMQFRQVSSYTPMEIWSYGIGRHLEAYIGYSLYHVMQTATFVSGISVVITLFLKYEAARVVKLKQTTRVLIITGILTPLFISITMEIILVTTQALPSQIRERYVMINANNTDHAVIGILSFDVVASQVNAITMSISVVLFPIVGSTSRSKILKHIRNTSDRVSAAKNAQNKIFVQGLTLQTFLPLFFYCPISCVYYYCIITRQEILFQQFFMFLLPAFPALFDPYITLYFITPYRNRLKSWMTKTKVTSLLTVVNSQLSNNNMPPQI
ncbi:CRE-SRD-41 protein [Caenorhabditis remanei]|uniref:CRE-SRD-41 protein n=1 Tax=Caenorhabditis remanei TaxID=31234 RepID=E3MJL1_CAERE|nr:CRE-SRD-41 protein [Caenorhabditis remanei]